MVVPVVLLQSCEPPLLAVVERLCCYGLGQVRSHEGDRKQHHCWGHQMAPALGSHGAETVASLRAGLNGLYVATAWRADMQEQQGGEQRQKTAWQA